MRYRHLSLYLVLASLLATVTLAGCASQPEPSQVSKPPESAPATSSVSSTSPATPLADLSIALKPVARGFSEPLWVTHAGDGSGRLFVLEQGGLVKVVRDGKVAPRPYLDVRDDVSSGGERGLLGLAFAPDFKANGRFYVNYTDVDGDTVVARYTADDPASDAPKLDGPDILFRIAQPYPNHNGGCIMFGPDGKLWVGMGDGGAAGDPQDRAQNPDELLGKMLRVDAEAAKGQVQPEIVQSGLRNPWRFSFDRETDDLWIGDVGQNAWEEIDVVPFAEAEGVDFGWNLFEGAHPYPPGEEREREGFTFPLIEYDRQRGQSVTGGYVYRGKAEPELVGTYLFGDFAAGWIAGAQIEEGRVQERTLLEDAGVTPSSFGEDEAGELYVCDYNGAILQVTASRR